MPKPDGDCWLHPGIEVRTSAIEGRGLFARHPLPAGTVVSRLGGRLVSGAELRRLIADPRQGYVDTITVTETEHLLLPPRRPNGYGNHCCDPNLWWVGPYELATRRAIAAGEELTNDYATSTAEPAFAMVCACGSPLCRGTVSGADWRRPELQDRYGEHWIPMLFARIRRTGGVDLAADPAGTAAASVAWSATGAEVRMVAVPADDDAVVELAMRAAKTGIDCPLGWPDAFVSFVGAHRGGAVPVPDGVDGKQWRRRLAWRHTDEVTRELTGLVPLSVSADRIGHTAMRCAAIQARLAQAGPGVDRSGTGAVVEVYPAASLKVWGLPWRGYKTGRNRAELGALVDRLRHAAPWLDLGEYEGLCRRSDHALDAVVAALTARAAVRDQVCRPDPGELPAARTEGWIAVPTASLAVLPG